MKAKPKFACHNWELDCDTITVTIPMTWKRRGGRKVIIAPDGGDAWAPAKPRLDETLIHALARAHRWKRLLEEKKYQSAGEVAEAEGVTRSFVNRLLRLTLLAPDIVEAILEGRQPKETMLQELRGPVPSDWEDQRVRLRGPNPNQGAKNGNLVTERRLAEGGQRCAFRETWSAFAETSSARSCSSERSSSRDDGRAA